MSNTPFLREQVLREVDKCGSIARVWANAFADTVSDPNRARTRHRKFPDPMLCRADSQSSKISAKEPAEQLAPAPAQSGSPSTLGMSGEDFYHAACVEAHRLLTLP